MTGVRPGWVAPLALLGAVCLWGLTPPATRLLVEDSFSPAHILLWRFLAGGLLSLGIIAAFRPALPARRDFGLAIALGLFGVLGFNVPLAFGVDLIESGIASLLLGTQPGFTALAAALYLREHISGRMIAGLGIALAGTVMVAFAGATGVELTGGYVAGCMLVLLAALAYSVYTVVAKPHLGARIPPTSVALIGTTAAFPFALPFGASGFGDAIASLDLGGWLAAILLAAGASVFAPILFHVGLSLGRASNAGVYLYLNPIFGAVASVILLGEELPVLAALGGALVIAGVAVATLPTSLLRRSRRREVGT
ncbi:MAG TPA: DMT family transporter [Thermomicrobiales bacterium]|nr:DMT family transporter [Thermomicrobiales bacterium]